MTVAFIHSHRFVVLFNRCACFFVDFRIKDAAPDDGGLHIFAYICNVFNRFGCFFVDFRIEDAAPDDGGIHTFTYIRAFFKGFTVFLLIFDIQKSP